MAGFFADSGPQVNIHLNLTGTLFKMPSSLYPQVDPLDQFFLQIVVKNFFLQFGLSDNFFAICYSGRKSSTTEFAIYVLISTFQVP